MEDLGHLIETLLEAEETSACFDDVVHVSSHGATGTVSWGQRIEALEGDRRWTPFLCESGALAPSALRLCVWPGPGAELGDGSAQPLQPQDRQRSTGGKAKGQP